MNWRPVGVAVALGGGTGFVVENLLGWPWWVAFIAAALVGVVAPDRWFGTDKATVDRRRERHATAVIGALYLGARYPADIWRLAGGPSWRTYFTLRRLEDDGRVESLPDGERRAYFLTTDSRRVAR